VAVPAQLLLAFWEFLLKTYFRVGARLDSYRDSRILCTAPLTSNGSIEWIVTGIHCDADASMNNSTSQEDAASRKVLARQARKLAGAKDKRPLWLQGFVVWTDCLTAEAAPLETLIIDDGSGLVYVDLSLLKQCDSACNAHCASVEKGNYSLVTGQVSLLTRSIANGSKKTDVWIRATTIRNLSHLKDTPLLETLWNSEVVDAWLDHANRK
jgi:RecQ-mediated genome instability protein 2